MRKIATILTVFFFQYGLSQTDQQIKEIFFNLPFHETKFNIRAQMHSSGNFYNYKELGFIYSSNFYESKYFRNIKWTAKLPEFVINFNYSGGSGQNEPFTITTSRTKSIKIYFTIEELNSCLSQYNALVQYLKPNAKEVQKIQTGSGMSAEKTGEGFVFIPKSYASFSSVNVTYIYYEKSKWDPEYYSLEITVYEDPPTIKTK